MALCVYIHAVLVCQCCTRARTGSMADPGSDTGRGLLAQPTPSDKLSVLWESLSLDFPEAVVSHSELNRTVRNFGFLATSFDQLDQWLESHGLLDFGSETVADLRCLWHRAHSLACSEGNMASCLSHRNPLLCLCHRNNPSAQLQTLVTSPQVLLRGTSLFRLSSPLTKRQSSGPLSCGSTLARS